MHPSLPQALHLKGGVSVQYLLRHRLCAAAQEGVHDLAGQLARELLVVDSRSARQHLLVAEAR